MFSIWCVISVRWYVCGIYDLCPEGNESNSTTESVEAIPEENPPPITESAPLTFEWSVSNPTTSKDFNQYLDSLKLIFDQSPASVVQITGLYDSQEVNNSKFENLGLARAENIKQLLLHSGIKRSIRTRAEENDLSAGSDGKLLHSFLVEMVPQEEDTTGFLITEAKGKIVVHFPSKDANLKTDRQVNNALKELANTAVKRNRRLLVVGHTDNQGDAMDNMRLGLIRATNVKDLLITFGMKENDVLAESEGEEKPLVSNTTRRGRQQNRRVEIIII